MAKTLGIIGGIGPESTIEYYRAVIAAYRDRSKDGNYPSIILNSINLKTMLDLMARNELGQVADLLVEEVGKLARAGADFALLASNTPHIVFDQVQQRSPIPMLSIVEATCATTKALGATRVGLFGSGYTMRARFYPEIFARAGIAVVLPSPAEQAFIHEKYMGELLNNIFLPDTRDRLLAIVEAMKQRDGIEALILGGTELPLILRNSGSTGIPFLDTTQIHARAAAERLD
jgi:aspartate racemase